jgi:hypothetical protein
MTRYSSFSNVRGYRTNGLASISGRQRNISLQQTGSGTWFRLPAGAENFLSATTTRSPLGRDLDSYHEYTFFPATNCTRRWGSNLLPSGVPALLSCGKVSVMKQTVQLYKVQKLRKREVLPRLLHTALWRGVYTKEQFHNSS